MGNAKTYEIKGCISCRLKFSLGKAQPFVAYFDGGVPDKGIPATYIAFTLGQQLAIENSKLFEMGRICLKKEKKKSAIKVAPPTATPAKPNVAGDTPAVVDEAYGAHSYPEVTSLVEAIGILKGDYGVAASRLKSGASVLRVAEEKNVSFPNLKL